MLPSRLLPTTQCVMSPSDEPLDLLCRKFNVAKVTLPPGSPIPPTIDMRVIKDAHVPSHVLAVFDTQESERGPSFQPIIVPIRADLYTRDFRKNIIPQSPPGTPYPVPHWIANLGGQYVTLPVVPTLVPHASSIPLLFLFALGLEPRSQLLYCRLLPSEVIEEFPAFPAMAESLARICADDQLIGHIRFNQGLWKNILALGPRDMEFIQVVQTAWNATVEARRIRQQAAVTRTSNI
ncbi:hypothetical protein EDC04DRAFT_1929984 [Pisolithus marmoratus]|nr:hypothetical protein EDC04DRAFT_1929984 [Pisolithus marmoratus]